jgi:uncharacterized membrane protein YeaQ/YmgE (transglycosylase-associated protein family)
MGMHFILFLIFGLVIGALARLIVPGKEAGGWGVSLLIGVAGAYLGGFVGRVLGLYSSYQTRGGWLMSLLGAIVLALIYHAIAAKRTMSGGGGGPRNFTR